MAGPGGAEVGRVHIRVVPDFTYFRKIMRAVLAEWDNKQVNWKVKVDSSEIKDATKAGVAASKQFAKDQERLSKKAAKGLSINAPSLDLNQALKSRIQRDLNKVFNDLEIRVNMVGTSPADKNALREYWQKEIDAVQKQINKLNDDGVKDDPRAFAAQARYAFSTLNALRKISGNVWDSPEIRKKMNETRVDFELFKKGLGDSEYNPAANNQMFAQEARAAAAISRMSKTFDDAFKIQGNQALREYIYGFRDMEKGIRNAVTASQSFDLRGTFEQPILRLSSTVDKIRMRGGIIGGLLGGAGAITGAKAALGVVDKVGSAAKGVGGMLSKLTPSFGTGLNLPAYALIAALITPVIALLSGLITAAPAAIAAVAVPIGVIALGIDGIKKAAESVGPAFTKLKEDVSSVFESGLIPGFNDVKDKLIPGLTSSFKGVALNLSNLFNGFMDNLTQQGNMDSLNNIIANTGVAAERALPGVKNFTTGILNLVSQLSNKFPGLSDAFNRTAESFLGWVQKITTVDSSGTTQLDRAMKTLGDTLSSLGGIISDLFASGFNNLGDAKFGDSMKSFVEDIRSLVSEVLPALAGAFEGIATALRPITALVEAGSKAMSMFNQATSPKFLGTDGKGNGVPDPGSSMSGLDKMQFMWDSFFNKEKAAKTMQEAIIGAAAAAQPAALTAGQVASKAYTEGVAAALAQDKEKQAAFLRAALTGTEVNEAVAAQISSQATLAIDGARQALIPLTAGLQTDINNALMPLGDIAGKVSTAFDGVPAMVGQSLGAIPGLINTNLGSIKTAADEAMTGFSEAFITNLAKAVTATTEFGPQVVGVVNGLRGQMQAAGFSMAEGLAAGIRSGGYIVTAAGSFIGNAALAAAKAAVKSKSPAKKFIELGENMDEGLAIGITGNAKGPISAIREVLQSIKDVFGSAEGLNLNFYMGEASSAMSSMATSSKEFRSNMVEAGTTPQLSGSGIDATAEELESVARDKAELSLRIKELQAEKNATDDKAAKAALQSQIDQLNIQKSKLDLMKEEGKLQEERKTAIQSLSDTIATNIVDTIKMPGDFAKATTNAAMQDLGISGNGAIPTIANWAMDAGSNFIFNVSNMDDALRGQQAQQRVQTLGVTG